MQKVRSKAGEVSSAVPGSSRSERSGFSTSEPVVHSVTHFLQYLLSTQGRCHLSHVAEDWLKLYKVK